jgi:hypothetical protein
LLLDKALYQRDSPEWVYVLIGEVSGYILVPMVSFVHILVSKGVGVVNSEILLKFDIRLSLLGRGDISMVRVVEALLLQYLFDALNVLYYFDGHLGIIWDVFVKRNELNPRDQIHEVARWHLRYQLPLSDNHYENVAFNVYDPDNSLSGILDPSFFVKLFSHYIIKWDIIINIFLILYILGTAN